jgi:hypothetical protein
MENKWKYDRFEIEFGLVSELTQRLNELGADGWEVIYYSETKPPKFGEKYKVVVLIKKRCDENKKSD